MVSEEGPVSLGCSWVLMGANRSNQKNKNSLGSVQPGEGWEREGTGQELALGSCWDSRRGEGVEENVGRGI